MLVHSFSAMVSGFAFLSAGGRGSGRCYCWRRRRPGLRRLCPAFWCFVSASLSSFSFGFIFLSLFVGGGIGLDMLVFFFFLIFLFPFYFSFDFSIIFFLFPLPSPLPFFLFFFFLSLFFLSFLLCRSLEPPLRSLRPAPARGVFLLPSPPFSELCLSPFDLFFLLLSPV